MSIPQDDTQTEAQQPAEDTGAATPLPEVDNAPPVKRGRGRPPKSASNETQKETVTGAAPKRGRPAKGASKKTYTVDEIGILGKQLVGIHQMVFMMTQIPETQLSDPEGLMLAQSIVNVADQYDLEIDGKTGAAIQLLATAAMIYAPRAIAFKRRVAQPQPQTEQA